MWLALVFESGIALKKEGISEYKLRRIAKEALSNTIRLHFDSILLFENDSYPSAFQLAVLALEEYSKATMVDHYIWTSKTNNGYPSIEFEQKWLKALYIHSFKQWNFVAREMFEFSPKFVELVKENKLDYKKQQATYVGLERNKGKVDVESRISTPFKIKKKDAKQIISLVNQELLRICVRIDENEFYFAGSREMDDVLDYQIYRKLLEWPYKTRLRGYDWYRKNLKRN